MANSFQNMPIDPDVPLAGSVGTRPYHYYGNPPFYQHRESDVSVTDYMTTRTINASPMMPYAPSGPNYPITQPNDKALASLPVLTLFYMVFTATELVWPQILKLLNRWNAMGVGEIRNKNTLRIVGEVIENRDIPALASMAQNPLFTRPSSYEVTPNIPYWLAHHPLFYRFQSTLRTLTEAAQVYETGTHSGIQIHLLLADSLTWGADMWIITGGGLVPDAQPYPDDEESIPLLQQWWDLILRRVPFVQPEKSSNVEVGAWVYRTQDRFPEVTEWPWLSDPLDAFDWIQDIYSNFIRRTMEFDTSGRYAGTILIPIRVIYEMLDEQGILDERNLTHVLDIIRNSQGPLGRHLEQLGWERLRESIFEGIETGQIDQNLREIWEATSGSFIEDWDAFAIKALIRVLRIYQSGHGWEIPVSAFSLAVYSAFVWYSNNIFISDQEDRDVERVLQRLQRYRVPPRLEYQEDLDVAERNFLNEWRNRVLERMAFRQGRSGFVQI